jgi:sugar O-acyltransferase (sialic acid O-acetyltransferase NeuD family)
MAGKFEIAGFLDDCYPEKTEVWSYPLLGTMHDLSVFSGYAASLVVAIGNNRVRKRVFESAEAAGFALPSIVHPSAVVSRRAVTGEGWCIMAGAVVGTEAVLGRGCVVNVNASVDHHCRLEDFAHLGVGVQLAGGARVGDSAWMQVGSSAGYGVEVPAGAVVRPGEGLSG